MAGLQEEFNKLLANPLLAADISPATSLEEIENKIAAEKGKLVTIYIEKMDSERVGIKVPEDKLQLYSIKRRFMQHEISRLILKKGYSWKYFWKHYGLAMGKQVFIKGTLDLNKYGVKDGTILHLVKVYQHKKQWLVNEPYLIVD